MIQCKLSNKKQFANDVQKNLFACNKFNVYLEKNKNSE